MLTFKNKHYTKRNYECTNIVAAVATQCPNENYQMCDESILDNLTKLYSQNGVTFYGFL